MERTYICDIKNNTQKDILISGFVENFRDRKSMAFIVLKDITGKVQVTVEKEKHPELIPELEKITLDSVITVIGQAVLSEYVKMGGVEVFPESIKVESVADALPIVREDIPESKGKAGVERSAIESRLDYRWIDLRTEKNQLMFKVQTELTAAMRNFLLEKNFI